MILPFEIILTCPHLRGAESCRSRRSLTSQRAYLLHARDAIDAVLDSTTDSRDAFCAGGKSSEDAVIRNIEVRGQAVKSLCADTRAHDDSIPWRQIAGMRDKLIHERSGVDLALVAGRRRP